MEILPKPATGKGPAANFTGDVWVDMLPQGDPPSRLRAGVVRFAPGAHTAWHRHVTARPSHLEGRIVRPGGEVSRWQAKTTPHPGNGTGTAPTPTTS